MARHLIRTRWMGLLLIASSGIAAAQPNPPRELDDAGFTVVPEHARVLYVRPDTPAIEVAAQGRPGMPLVYMGRPGEPRPRIHHITSRGPLRHVWFIGLEIGSPDGGGGIELLAGDGPISDILIEDCLIHHARTNVVVQARRQFPAQRITVRRCIIRDSHAHRSHAQGLFAYGVAGLVIEQNVFDHNGWASPDDRTMFNHAAYIQSTNTDILVRDNILARSSSHGLNLHAGGLIEHNLLWDNPIGISLTGERRYTVRHNLIAGAGDIRPDLPRGVGITIDRRAEALIQANLLLDRRGGRPVSAIKLEHHGEPRHITIRDNLVRAWDGIDAPDAVVEANRIDPPGYTWSLDDAARSRGFNNFAAMIEALSQRPRGQWNDDHTAAAIIAEARAAAE